VSEWIITLRFPASDADAHALQRAVIDLVKGREGINDASIGLRPDADVTAALRQTDES
jgi:hypothetical protein